MRAKATAVFIVTLVLRAAASPPLVATAPGPSQALQQGDSRLALPRRSTSRAESPAASMPETRRSLSSTPELSQELSPRGAPSSSDTVATASFLASSPVKTTQAMDADTAGAARDATARGGAPESLQAAGSQPDSDGLANAGVASGASQAQTSANDTASLASSGGLVFDGAGHLISAGTGFGDSPPAYTGKQDWPELVGENAALAKAQLVAETRLQVILVPAGSAVTTDYRTSRIRIFYDPTTFVVVRPSPSVG